MLDRALTRLRDPDVLLGPIDLESAAGFAEALRDAIDSGAVERAVESRPKWFL
jgi:hypothetical protein